MSKLWRTRAYGCGLFDLRRKVHNNMRTSKKLKYAMVGGAIGSFIGPIHRMALRMENLADIVAGSFSRDAAKNGATGEELGIPKECLYDNYRTLIAAEKDNIDFLVIVTPNDSHYAIAKTALEAGIDVLCEKPLSMTAREAEDLGKIAKKHKRILGIPFTYTGYPMIKLARDLIKAGKLGRIDKIVMEYQQGSFRKIDFSKPLDARNKWKMDPKKSGPSCVVADIGVHAFTLIEYISGLEVKKLLADLSSFAPGNRLDDDASILLRLEKGAKASLVVSKVATGEANGLRMRFYGEKASLHWDQENPNELHVKHPQAPEQTYRRKENYIADCSAACARTSRFPAGHPEGFVEALANIYEEFCRAIRDRKAHDYPSAREGVRSMRFVDAALASSHKDATWVTL